MREPGFIKRAPRVATSQKATLVDSRGRELDVQVEDISKTGFRLTSADQLSIGEHVQLRVERYGAFPAQIRWALGGEAGAVFLEPVNLA